MMNQIQEKFMCPPDDYHLNNNKTEMGSFDVSSNWDLTESTKNFRNVISIGSVNDCSNRMTLEDIVDEKGCIEVKRRSDDSGPCTLDIKLKNKDKKISRIGIVSEASVLEIFQDFGEYTTTIFADFIDEFEDSSVYYAEVAFERPSSEVSIKFTRIKNNRPTMFLYGVRLLLQQSEVSKTAEHLDLNFVNECLRKLLDNRSNELEKLCPSINGNDDNVSSRDDLTVNNYAKSFTRNAHELLKSKDFLTNRNYGQEEKPNMENQNTSSCNGKIEALLDLKITEMEERLSKKIDLIESKTNEKLDKILKLLESLNNSNETRKK
ncbi:uncharacterized protein LOC130675629 [Microplitis mediator]|uniref:uncharacterized protein LOC130675629 n=1 Tax=Microplitis mediator TaxID=375433 RepID=UPI002556E835|nr:uncharacterized protein LOC130675629 [Microplitis mediator]